MNVMASNKLKLAQCSWDTPGDYLAMLKIFIFNIKK